MAELDPRFAIHHLNNGLTVLFERMADAPSAAAGFMVRTGARDETPAIQGVSHFLEHMMFKGTAKRSAFQINVDFDEMGAEYNAYTGNEETFYFGWVRPAALPRLLELLADMMRSVMPPDDFETEKKVILEEIAMYEDHLESYTVDQLLTRGFGAHPLGGSVLGSVETVSALTRDQMAEYFQARYTPENMLLVVCGNFDPDATLSEIESLCGERTRERPQSRGRAATGYRRGLYRAVESVCARDRPPESLWTPWLLTALLRTPRRLSVGGCPLVAPAGEAGTGRSGAAPAGH